VKRAVSYMLSTNPTIPPILIAYDDKAVIVPTDQVQNIGGGGMTSFSAAIRQIRSVIEEMKIESEIAVIFMTDGGDNTGSQHLPEEMRLFSELVRKHSKKILVHTIGFTTSCATAFLDKIRAIGTTEGMHRYVLQSKDLEGSFAEIFDFLDLTRSYKLTIGSKTREVEVEMKKAKKENQQRYSCCGWSCC